MESLIPAGYIDFYHRFIPHNQSQVFTQLSHICIAVRMLFSNATVPRGVFQTQPRLVFTPQKALYNLTGDLILTKCCGQHTYNLESSFNFFSKFFLLVLQSTTMNLYLEEWKSRN